MDDAMQLSNPQSYSMRPNIEKEEKNVISVIAKIQGNIAPCMSLELF